MNENEIKNFIDINYNGVSNGISTGILSNNEDFFYSTGSIPELSFKYNNNTIYDLASLTKPVVTATLIMKYVEKGIISLEDNLKTFNLYTNEEISNLKIKELITHTSGLIPTFPLYEFGKTKNDYLRAISVLYHKELKRNEEYSDLNFILLGFILEEIENKSLDKIAYENIFKPLNMKNSFFNPEIDKMNIAPTEKDKRGLVWGKVHDEKSYYLNGIAGHAGLFSNLIDISIFAKSFMNYKILRKSTVNAMITPQNEDIGGMFGLGWMIKLPVPKNPSISFGYNAFMGEISNYGVIGHTGFTGTSLCMDLENKIAVMVFTNRVYPSRENLKILRFRRLFHNFVFSNIYM